MSEFSVQDLAKMYVSKEHIKENLYGEYKPQSFWDGYGSVYIKTFGTGEDAFILNIDHLVPRLNSVNPKSVLEVGCGFGRILPFVCENVKGVEKVVGVEHSLSMIETNKEYSKRFAKDYQYEIVHGNAKELPFEDNSFDLVYTHVCLTHIPPREIPQVTSEISRVAKTWIVHLERFAYPYEHPNPHRWSHMIPPFYTDNGWELMEFDRIHKEHETCAIVFKKQ